MIHDATVKDAADIELLKGIVEVETNLRLYGSNLTRTTGLEDLQTVGSLDLDGLTGLTTTSDGPQPFSGLSGLKLIRGNLQIANVPLSRDRAQSAAPGRRRRHRQLHVDVLRHSAHSPANIGGARLHGQLSSHVQ